MADTKSVIVYGAGVSGRGAAEVLASTDSRCSYIMILIVKLKMV